ncbi:LysR family transcriptional regulator [Listeria seeligeri]|uniref:LysR family transcriptional regulator n=2 Tax=Listeria seeligeri TaxID=1640 RepID=A0ABR5E971_LISSE|nr:LysR family transcriptional regulator [Listeria seeligeri]EFR99377.1 LysR family transcriptional regulator [Listeria seeligeri FSL N1-067]KKD46966.1 LysR family transcriptional regulator [Listeria seeligeri]MBC1577497.1 LysR family transcriptional regulator [Listeria seeligeri]MBC1915698.1 LysR family transcriptional regulator [Listeria seeligeri]MBC1988839.1 LysR family transcriptional regulator [Listeria seeligeri]
MDEALRTYIRVVELKSFTKASEELHISQPAVSLQLKKLEQQYDTELIYRQAKKFVLTATGEMLYHRAKQLEGLYKQVEDEISLYHHHLKGRLRIGASFTIGEYYLPKVIAKFHALYPDITIELIIENTAKIADKVELLQVDTGLIEGQISKKDLELSAFLDDEMCIVGAANGSMEEIENGATWIAREEGSGTREYLDHVISTSGWNVTEQVIAWSNMAVKQMVLEGLGYTVISKCVVETEIKKGELRTFNEANTLLRKFSVLKNKQTLENRTVETFLQFLRENK